jgi:hypothetical protein
MMTASSDELKYRTDFGMVGMVSTSVFGMNFVYESEGG